MRIDLKKLIMEYECPNEECIHEKEIGNCKLSLLQLRDFLINAGEVLYEDTENKVYIASIRSGKCGINGAKFAMQLRGSKLIVVGYAKEGLIKQNLWRKAYDKLETACLGENATDHKPKFKFKKYLLYGLLTVVAVVVIGIALLFGEVQQTCNATRNYNDSVKAYNEQAELYNQMIEKTSVDNISGLPVVLETLKTEKEGFIDNLFVVLGPNNKDIIATDKKTIDGMTEQAKEAVALLQQITAPEGDWVIEKLSNIEDITGVEAVTEELDPDGLLDKEGGFTDCVYFTVSHINPNDVIGDGIVAKGTDAGGAVEVYSTVQDAEARCEYLAGFDGTVLYSGSYAIVGTMVIRTSYKLTNVQQMELTNAITMALTSK